MISCLRSHLPPIFVDCPLSNGGALLLAGTTVVGSGGFDESFWVGDYFKVLIFSVIYVSISLKSFVGLIISHQIIACWIWYLVFCIQLRLSLWVTFHRTCYLSCCFILEYWSLRYEDRYRRNIAMVIIWWYMAQMSVNEQITWLNQCVQHVIRFE